MGELRDLRSRLERARSRRHLVRITRDIPGAERLEGFVVGVGSKWVLLAAPDDRARPDGHRVIRLRDVERVWRSRGTDRFIRRSWELQDVWPPAPPTVEVDLGRTGNLLTTLSQAFDVITVFDERNDPDVCFVGQVSRRRGSRFTLDEISPQAEWDGMIRSRHGRVSRVDVGGGYEAALRALAGPRDPRR